jgi:hypothetical protein
LCKRESSEVFVLSPVTLCLRIDEKIEEHRLRVQQLATAPPHGFVASQDYLTKAAEAAMAARELEDRGQMAKAKEAYLIAIGYVQVAQWQYANDPSRRELVQT